MAPTGLSVMRQAQTMVTLTSTAVQMPVATSQVTSMVVASRAWERRTTRATEMEQTLVLCVSDWPLDVRGRGAYTKARRKMTARAIFCGRGERMRCRTVRGSRKMRKSVAMLMAAWLQ